MKKLFVLLVFVCAQNLVLAQENFQQKVDHNIKVKLDPASKSLEGLSAVDYYNNSPDTLTTLVFHVWMNAFGDKNSSFARQQLRFQSKEFHFAHDSLLGFYERLLFKTDMEPLEFEYFKSGNNIHKDIVVLHLKNPILPHSIQRIDIDFKIKLPHAFDRPGIKNNLFCMTQWYPKPAVYDKEGWHPMSYLSLGEFYSEFGDYRVEMEIPVSFSVASTGTQNVSLSTIDIANRSRTQVYEANNVHDFAWFASEDYLPFQENLNLNGRDIRINLFVRDDNDNWERAFKFADRALRFYSENLIEYPYRQLTIVEDGGDDVSGMEYPMITLLNFAEDDKYLDHLISHETGHQWFYSILAPNERVSAWIDEGLTSYFDEKYRKQYYSSVNIYDDEGLRKLYPESNYDIEKQFSCHLMRTGYMQSITASSDAKDPINYVVGNYVFAKEAWKFLEAYLGESDFSKALERIFKQRSHKHIDGPYLKQAFESVNSKNLDWFFDDYLNLEDMTDVSVALKNNQIIIHRQSSSNAPFRISYYDSNNKNVLNSWSESNGEKEQVLNIPKLDVKYVRINEGFNLREANVRNNSSDNKAFDFPQVRMLNVLASSQNNTIGFLPHAFYNTVDGVMAGASFYSALMPQSSFRYVISPSYAFGTKDIRGAAFFEKDIKLSKGQSRKLTIGLGLKRYGFYSIPEEIIDEDLHYSKINPSVTWHYGQDMFQFGSFYYRYHHIYQRRADFVSEPPEFDYHNFKVHQLGWQHTRYGDLVKRTVKAELQYESYEPAPVIKEHYLKMSLSWDGAIAYNAHDNVYVRLFGSYFIDNSQRESNAFSNVFSRGSIALTSQGYTDLTYEDFYIDRNGGADAVSKQIHIRDGGFKNALGYAQNIGLSNDYLIACNLRMDMPFLRSDIRIRPYLDMALSSTKDLLGDDLKATFFYSGGLALEVDEGLGVYIPLVNSDALNQGYASSQILKRISFKIDLSRLNLWEWADQPAKILGKSTY